TPRPEPPRRPAWRDPGRSKDAWAFLSAAAAATRKVWLRRADLIRRRCGRYPPSEYKHRCSYWYPRVQSLQVRVAPAYTAVAHGFVDRVHVVDVAAVEQVATPRHQLVGTEGIRHAPVGRAHGRDEDLVVEHDLQSRRERPEVAVLV